jgi:hypothetical protein
VVAETVQGGTKPEDLYGITVGTLTDLQVGSTCRSA